MTNNVAVIVVTCPHCNTTVQVLELNCRIFRCGIIKSTGQQINPHAPKAMCNAFMSRNLIYGCGKPFRVDGCPPNELIASKCDYI